MKTQKNWYIRLVLLGLLLLGTHLTTDAQQAFYVYRHNGIVNSFFYADCDSITYAKEPMEASPQTTEFVQIIHMQDSVFRIPVNEIDSVSFYKPETVYQPGVIKLEEKLFSYVVRKDSLTLILSGNTPTELIPKQGDKLVTLEMNEIFPSGFMGEVVEVGKDANNYLVRCEPPLLTDIFESYYYEGCFDLQSAEDDENEKQTITRAWGDVVWPPVDRQFLLPDISMALNAGTLGLNMGPCSSSVSQTLSYTLKSKMRLRTSLQVNNGVHLHFTMTGEHSLVTSISASVEGSVRPELDATIPVPIPIAPGMEFYFSFGPFVEVSGSFNGEYSQAHYFNSAVHYEYDSGSPSNIPAQIKLVPKGQDDPKGDFHGNVSFKFGTFAEMGVAFASKDVAKVGIAYEKGAAIDVRMDLGGPAVSSPPNTSVYDKYKDNDVITMSMYKGCEFRLQALYAEASVGVEVALGDPYLRIGAVPNFENVKAGMSESNIDELYATANVNGRCFGKHRVGFALYHGDKLLDKAYYNTPYDGSNPLTMSHIFKGLTPGEEYTVYPMVELFGNSELLATPSSKAESRIKVLTGGSSRITTQSATISATVEGFNANTPCEYGISYQKTGSSEWVDVPSTGKGGGTFSCTINGLSSNTSYSYRAYLRVKGIVIYGAIRMFRTEKEAEAYEVITSGMNDLTSSSVLLSGIVSGVDESTPCEYGIAYKERNSQNWTEVAATSRDANGVFASAVTGLAPYTDYDYRAYLHVDGKDFWGEIQCFRTEYADLDSSVLAVLQEFYDSAHGSGWYSQRGWLEKSIPLTEWYGFEPSTAIDELYDLKLENNNLTGNVVLRNSNFISSVSLSGNPIQSLTVENCKNLWEIVLPGQGETLRIATSSGNESYYGADMTVNVKGNGHIGLLDISQHSYRLIAFGGNQSVSDIYIDKLNYTDVNQDNKPNIGSNFNSVAVGQLNMNNVYGNCTVSFKEIEELNISDVYPMHNNLIGRWDIGNSYLDGHIRKANIDQGGKLPFSIYFNQYVDVVNIRNMSHIAEKVQSGDTFFWLEEGVGEVNIDNLQLGSSMFRVWTPSPVVVNITNSSFMLSDSANPSADNVFNLVNCDVCMATGTDKRKHDLTFRGTMSQLREYLEKYGY